MGEAHGGRRRDRPRAVDRYTEIGEQREHVIGLADGEDERRDEAENAWLVHGPTSEKLPR